jgi:hypothetical protein
MLPDATRVLAGEEVVACHKDVSIDSWCYINSAYDSACTHQFTPLPDATSVLARNLGDLSATVLRLSLPLLKLKDLEDLNQHRVCMQRQQGLLRE